MKSIGEKLVVAVKKPDKDFFELVVSEMHLLTPSRQGNKLNDWDADLKGDLEQVIRALREVVCKDWEKNTTETVP